MAERGVAEGEEPGSTMNQSLAEHIQSLEERLNLISARIMQEDNPVKRNYLESELRAVESALTQYRSAFEIENRLSADSYSS